MDTNILLGAIAVLFGMIIGGVKWLANRLEATDKRWELLGALIKENTVMMATNVEVIRELAPRRELAPTDPGGMRAVKPANGG